VFETSKKKEVGVSDLTLISKITNEAINENLQKRFENREIYVRCRVGRSESGREAKVDKSLADIHRTCTHLCQSVSRFGDLHRGGTGKLQG